jgi:hypothetical protein
MSGESFNSFSQFARPDIGLISDGFQNLSEIFQSNKRDALRNILLAPESLDQIYGLSEVISREDLRSTSGLSRFLLSTLHQIDNISRDRILESLEVEKRFFSPRYPLGGSGSSSLNTPNIVIFNGAIRCQGAFYRANVINESLFGNPTRQIVPLSTSRASVFNSVLDLENPGFYKSSSYSGSIRVRRRSHVNRIFLPESSFVRKPEILEAPSHTIQLNVGNGNTGVTTPVKLLATKNSPVKIFCRLSRGEIKFTFTDSLAPYFFGYQIQPVTQRPNTTFVDFLQVDQVSQESGSESFTLNLDITRTGYQTVYDLYLYLYVNPGKIKEIEFKGVDIRESPDKKDMGLIGFDNLEVLRISGGSMTILPLWLKTLSNKLRVLDLRDSGDSWKSGPMAWFDIRNPSAVPSFSHPLYTAVGYLTIPKKGPMINEDGNDWSDEKFRKYILNESRTPGVDFRQFTQLTELYLGDRFRGLNPNLNDVFPNLRKLDWRSKDSEFGTFLSGLKLPSIKNTGALTEYNISGSGASGTIYDIGTSLDPEDDGYISKYRVESFNISGRISARHNITGYIGNPAEDWSNWYLTTVSINADDTAVTINLQSNEWKSLTKLQFVRVNPGSSGFQFSTPSSPLRTPSLRFLDGSGSNLNGQVPSLGSSSTLNTGDLRGIDFYDSRQITAVVKNGVNYLLPENFAPLRSSGTPHRLFRINFAFTNFAYRFRERDLINLNELSSISLFNAGFLGRFPIIPDRENPAQQTKSISISAQFSNFYDISNISINSNNPFFGRDAVLLNFRSQNVERGGARLPSFEGVPDSRIEVLLMDNTLRSTYGENWHIPSSRGSCVRDTDPPTEISGLSIQRIVQNTSSVWTENDNLYILSGVSALNTRVMVNDVVRSSAAGANLARVLSVSPTQIIIDQNIPGALPATLFFFRRTVDITDWFSQGFSSLVTFSARSCRLSGSLNLRPSLPSLTSLNFSGNSIANYTVGSLSKIFLGNSRTITVDLSNNNLSIESIRSIISETIQLDSQGRFRNCNVRIGFNKLDSDVKYINYTQTEIFATEVRKGPDVITSLFRNEEFYVYETVVSFNEFGEQTTTQNVTGTRIVQIPGVLVDGIYYKTVVNETQITVESSLAIGFKNLSGIRVNLGFNYVSPPPNSTITSTSYTNQTTRNQSIIEVGLNPQDLVNP